MLLLQSEEDLTILAVDDVLLSMMRIPLDKQLCDTYTFEKLLFEKNNRDENNGILHINLRMERFLDFLIECISDGLRCTHYFDLKINEFLFILHTYYEKEDLFYFFYPILSSDLTFSQVIIQNSHRVKTVKEFANFTNYSLSGFQKKFKKVFGISAHQWLNSNRAKSILHDIKNSNLSLKELCYNYGFSSQSYFNEYCKTNFGTTPGKIRDKSKN